MLMVFEIEARPVATELAEEKNQKSQTPSLFKNLMMRK
jgi:hypothetical protein